MSLHKFTCFCTCVFLNYPLSQPFPKVPTRCVSDIHDAFGIQLIEYPQFHSEPALFSPPQSIDQSRFNKWLPHYFPRTLYKSWIAVINDACVLPISRKPLDGTIFDKNQQFLVGAFSKVEPNTIENMPVERYEKLAPVGQLFHPAFYHWLIEGLSRVTLLLDVLRKDPAIKILVPYANYVAQYMRILGLEDRCVWAKRGTVYFSKKIYLARPEHCGAACRESVWRTKKEMFHALGLASCSQKERTNIVLVYRTKPPRAIDNFFELVNAVKRAFPQFSHDIILFTGKEPIIDQIKIFRKAKIILAPHGAGLANMIYAESETPVIEFFPVGRGENFCFWHLAQATKMNYWNIGIPENQLVRAAICRSMRVPIGETITLMKKLL